MLGAVFFSGIISYCVCVCDCVFVFSPTNLGVGRVLLLFTSVFHEKTELLVISAAIRTSRDVKASGTL